MTTEQATPKARTWTGFFWNLMMLAAIAVAAGVFFVQYLQHRTYNLIPQSDSLAATFEQLLKNNHVPADGIVRGAVQLNQEENTAWHLHPFTITLPSQITAEGLITQLQKELLPYKVTLLEEATTDNTRHIQLAIGTYHFADAYLVPQKEPVALPRDLRGPALDATQEIEALLLEAKTNPDLLHIARPEKREAGGDLWAYNLIQVQLPPTLTPGEVKRLIDEKMPLHNLRVHLATPDTLTQIKASPFAASEPMTDILHVQYETMEFVEIQCYRSSPAETQALRSPAETIAASTDLNTLLLEALPKQEELPLESAEVPDETPTRSPIPPKARNEQDRARIAIILDDGGYGGEVTEAVLALDSRLSLAILPNTPHAADTAEEAHAKGFEVMLHMPMETLSEEVKAFPGELTVDMDADTLQLRVTQALDQIPHAVGVNNHTGSKFMAETASVRQFMGILQEKGLFFIDSRTHESSQGHDLAREIHLASASRQVFLDNDPDPAAIQQQFDALVALARETGQAIGIGHFRENTAAFLAEALPALKKEGIELVPVSEFVE